MQLADFLQCTLIVGICLTIIKYTPTVKTLPLYVRYTTPTMKQMLFYDEDLILGAHSHLRSHYIDIIQHQDFVTSIMDVDDLNMFIDPGFPLQKEWHVLIFQVVVKWLEFSESRQVYANQLLTKVCYGHMKITDIMHEVLPNITQFCGCEDLIGVLRSYVEKPFEQPFIAAANFLSIAHRKCDKEYVRRELHAFGIHDLNISTDVVAFCVKPESKRKQITLRYWPTNSRLGILEPRGDVIGHYAFIVGGYTKDPGSESKIPANDCKRYNMITGEILDLAPLPQASFWHAAIIHQKEQQMWVFGGVVKGSDHIQLSQSVHIYDIKTNAWRRGPDLPEPLSQIAVCYSPMDQGGIFISGGITQRQDRNGKSFNSNFRMVRSGIYLISSESEMWEQLGSLQIPRYGHAMYVDVAKEPAVLYIIGGKNVETQHINAVEYFSSFGQGQIHIPTVTGNISIRGDKFYGTPVGTTSNLVQIGALPKWQSSDFRLDCSHFPFSLKDALILSSTQEIDMESKDPRAVTKTMHKIVLSRTHMPHST